MKRYLEYMTSAERASAASAGQSGIFAAAPATAAARPERLPDWMAAEAKSDMYMVFGGRIKDAGSRSTVVGGLGQLIFNDASLSPAGKHGTYRMVAFQDGTVLWGSTAEVIHRNIVMYAMLKGMLPMEKYVLKSWTLGACLDMFVALEYTCSDAGESLRPAESYHDDAVDGVIAALDGEYSGVAARFGRKR